MPAFNPKIFNGPDRLKQISPARLKALLGHWQDYFVGRGIDIAALPDGELPLDDISHVLMNPSDAVPDEMIDALYYVNETASNEVMDELLERAEKAGIEIEKDYKATVADVSVQIWLADPILLQRQHAETVIFNRANFMYFAGSRSKDKPKPNELPTVSKAAAKTMQKRMDDWFELKRRARKCRIFAFRRGNKVWFSVRHGMPWRREGSHQEDGESGIAAYRPQQYDVLIYDSETDEIGVNAGTKGERTLYLETFGKELFGSETYFDRSERYTLDPLRERGPDAMACQDIAGITGVRLVEFGRRWPGKISEQEIRKADDLFKLYGENWEKRLAHGAFTHATFKFAFEGSKRERSVTIRPANIAKYDHDTDDEVIEAWLKARGFWKISTDAEDDADPKVLESA